MPRARNIKPGFFKNENLAELPVEARLLFVGLWTLADRRGRLEDRPKRIKMEIFPADDFDVDGLLQQLHDMKFIERYGASTVQVRCKNQRQYIQVLAFEKHQNPHKNERESDIPKPEDLGFSTVQAQYKNHSAPADSLIPDSLIPEDSEPNGSDGEPSLEQQVWSIGLSTLSRISGKAESSCRTLLGKWRKAHDDSAVLAAIIDAERQAVSDPAAWVTATLKARCPEGRSKVVDLYREILVPTLPDVIDLDAERKRRIGELSSGQLNTMDQWRVFFDAVSESPVLTGRKPWRNGETKAVDFDFLLKHGVKIMEGKYDD
jgi:hypothetical protein